MPLTSGTRLGAYEIIAPLGAGGMGEVYRARDPRLGRDVAIKVLPAATLDDDTARARLLREARLAATLNHPNICTIHEVGEADGQLYLAMELIEGRPLSEVIAGHGAGLSVETVTRYGAQIAAALAHAHERHVIHRDLKCSNVMVTADGRLKVLDFGVARRTPGVADDTARTPHPTLTDTGALVGTPQYLAPEVLAGGAADERSDLWALGVLLYEMASGVLPFRGTTSFELAAAIMHAEPVALPERVPAGLRAVIARCMAKAPGERYARASEVRAALEALQAGGSDTRTPPVKTTSRAPLVAMTVLGLAVALVAIALVRRQSAQPRELKQRQLTSSPESDPVGTGNISPDGKTLAVAGRSELSLRSIETGESHSLDLPQGFTFMPPLPHISWYPDGSQLLISGSMADGRTAVWALPVAGGRTRKILDDAGLANPSPDGTRIVYRRRGEHGSEIWVCGVDGADAVHVTGDDSSGVITLGAVWSPSGKRLAYARADIGAQVVRLESCDLAGRARALYVPTVDRPLHFYTVPAWLPDGRVVFGLTDPAPNQRDVNLWSLRVDPRSGAPSGSPRRITQWQHLALVEPTACSADGKRLSVGVLEYQSDVFVGRVAGRDSSLRDIRRITLDDRMDMMPAWMADGSTLIFASDRNGTFDIFRQRIDASVAEPVVTGPGDQYSPQASPDRAWILYLEVIAPRPGVAPAISRLMRIPVAGGPATKVLDVQLTASFACPQASGASPVLCEVQRDSVVFSAFDPLRGRGRELARAQAHRQSTWSLSPSGSTIAMVADSQDSIPSIRLLSTHGAPPRDVRLDRPLRIQDIAYGDDEHSWLIVQGGDQWRLLHVDARGRTTPLIPPQMWMYSSAASPDGRWIAFTSNTGQGNIWMLEDF